MYVHLYIKQIQGEQFLTKLGEGSGGTPAWVVTSDPAWDLPLESLGLYKSLKTPDSAPCQEQGHCSTNNF